MSHSSALRIVPLGAAAAAVREQGVPVHGADATGLALHLSGDGHLGADMLRVPPHTSFPIHVHPGHHLLLCLEGEGTITVDQVTHRIRPGDLYMVDGQVPHAVGAGDTEHVLVAIGAPHKPVDDPSRMTFTDWQGFAVDAPLFHTGPATAPADADRG
ncbi:cupin domain-containing protein [Actinomadura miaoliensis]|uniref:Cupin type-2 domain-containing protein n=1 Tax=Actinomadura miaoliensis TaxID=430685 RepID=A0ABP7WBA1_9ACTN